MDADHPISKHQMSAENKPLYFRLLLQHEKFEYEALQARLADPNHRYNRNRRLDTFQDMLEEIREFCEGPDSWRRCLACGVCWGSDFVGTNTQQLRFVLGKSKSSINGVFAKMGLDISAGRDSDISELTARIPFLKGRLQEVRQWTIRRKSDFAVPIDAVQMDESSGEFSMEEPFSFENPFRDRMVMGDVWDEPCFQTSEFKFQPDEPTSSLTHEWDHRPAM
jgi:hypothetical protein